MMPELVAELAAKKTVAVARLFEFKFLSATTRFWDGLGWLDAGGRRWQGSGNVISVSGLDQGEGLSASKATFSLSGTTPELLAAAVNSESEVTNRPCTVYIQFLSKRNVALDNPIPIWTGRMDAMEFSGDVRTQTINLNAEGLFVDRVRATHGLQTDTDQQARWPGDRGFEFMPSLVNKDVPWLRS